LGSSLKSLDSRYFFPSQREGIEGWAIKIVASLTGCEPALNLLWAMAKGNAGHSVPTPKNDRVEVVFERGREGLRQHGHAVPRALALPDHDPASREIDILHPMIRMPVP
jgi:hypothetical protein